MKRLAHICLVLLFCVFASHASAGARHQISPHSLIVKDNHMITVSSAVTHTKKFYGKVSLSQKSKNKNTDTGTPSSYPNLPRTFNFLSHGRIYSTRNSRVNHSFTMHNRRGPPAFL